MGSVDAVALEARAAELAKRSIKRESKIFALELAIRMMDLTTLEGADTPGKVRAMCAKAMRPDPTDPSVPHVAAVCVYPNLVAVAQRAAGGKRRQGRVGRDRLPVRPGAARGEARRRRAAPSSCGADEIDMVIDRGAFLSGRIRAGLRGDRRGQGGVRRRAPEGDPRDGRARLATTPCARRRCSRSRRRRLHQDVDRQGQPGGDAAGDALHARGDPRRPRRDGPRVGMKPAGGIRTAKQALQYLVLAQRDARPGAG